MNEEFEVKDEEVEIIEGVEELTDSEQEESDGGASVLTQCRGNCFSIYPNRTPISNLRVVSNTVGARCTWSPTFIQIIRPAGRKGNCKVRYKDARGSTIEHFVKFI